MNDYLVGSNRRDVEAGLKKTFKEARTINYRIDSSSLRGVAKYPNKWYHYLGAIDADECSLAIFILALVYGFFGALDFLVITNVVWTWIVFAITCILSTISACVIIDTDRYSQDVVVLGLSVVVALITLLVYWQIQQANSSCPQTIHLDFLFKFHFSKP